MSRDSLLAEELQGLVLTHSLPNELVALAHCAFFFLFIKVGFAMNVLCVLSGAAQHGGKMTGPGPRTPDW